MARRTGFPPSVRQQIMERAGHRCEAGLRGCTVRVDAIHHRRARGMGSTRRADTNCAANGLAVCDPCHRFIEGNRKWALMHGFLVRQNDDPATVPVKGMP